MLHPMRQLRVLRAAVCQTERSRQKPVEADWLMPAPDGSRRGGRPDARVLAWCRRGLIPEDLLLSEQANAAGREFLQKFGKYFAEGGMDGSISR
jgi:hypothetical protein